MMSYMSLIVSMLFSCDWFIVFAYFLNTVAVGAKPVYVANTYPPAVQPARPMATAIKLIQTTPLSTANAVSLASYTYQPVATHSVYVCSQSAVSTPTVVKTSTVSSHAAATVGRIPSLASGTSYSFLLLHNCSQVRYWQEWIDEKCCSYGLLFYNGLLLLYYCICI